MSFSAWLMVGLERKTGQQVWANVCMYNTCTCYTFGAHVLFIVMYIYICTEKKKRNFNLNPGPWGFGCVLFLVECLSDVTFGGQVPHPLLHNN